MKKLLSRIRAWAIASRLAVHYGFPYEQVRPLVDEMGEFGAELTLYVAKRFALELPEARQKAIEGLVGLSQVVKQSGSTADELGRKLAELSLANMGKGGGVNAPGGKA
jgi:hypothetical protein